MANFKKPALQLAFLLLAAFCAAAHGAHASWLIQASTMADAKAQTLKLMQHVASSSSTTSSSSSFVPADALPALPRRVAAGGPAAAGQDAWASLWAQWKAHYGKTYPDAHGLTEAQAFATFAANMQKVVEHNLAAQATYWLSGNEHSDLDPAAASARHLTDPSHLERLKRRVLATGYQHADRRLQETLPPAVDWKAQGKVTPPKNQGTCGACWAATAAGALESAYLIGQGLTTSQVPGFSLSEQQLYDCADGRYGNSGCSGGGADGALLYAHDHRVATTNSYPVTGQGAGVCREDSVPADQSVRLATPAYTYVSPASNEAALLAAVAQSPVIVYIAVGAGDFWAYSGGVYQNPQCADAVNHAMLVVGYDQPSRTLYLKNSWGTGWGEGGFMKLPMTGDGPGFCLLYTFMISATTKFDEAIINMPPPA